VNVGPWRRETGAPGETVAPPPYLIFVT
jgi:hypothetical protein